MYPQFGDLAEEDMINLHSILTFYSGHLKLKVRNLRNLTRLTTRHFNHFNMLLPFLSLFLFYLYLSNISSEDVSYFSGATAAN